MGILTAILTETENINDADKTEKKQFLRNHFFFLARCKGTVGWVYIVLDFWQSLRILYRSTARRAENLSNPLP